VFKLATTFYEGGDMAMSFIELTYVLQKEFMDMDLKLTTISPLQTIITNMQKIANLTYNWTFHGNTYSGVIQSGVIG